ncbi:MAG: cation diffusion facilitator family transporter [Syntrophorhabdales bacterium]|jgi:cation diffusion facilitator family transporter
MEVKQKASAFAVCTSLALAVAKFAVGLVSGSMTVVSSGLDSLLDVFMSGMNLFAIRKAAQPADDDHQYGHGKAESIAGTIQAVVIVLTGAFIIYKAVKEFLDGERIAYSYWDLWVMCLSLVFSLVISSVLRRTGRRTESDALKADALHYTSDLYSNSAAIAAIVLAYYSGWTFFDHAFAVITGLIIAFSAVKILKGSVSGLMDRRIPPEIEREIKAIIEDMPFPYAGYHKLRTRFSGNKKYVDFHLLTCRKLRIDEAHELADEIEGRIAKKIASLDTVIHVEPCAFPCELTEGSCTVIRMRLQKEASRLFADDRRVR